MNALVTMRISVWSFIGLARDITLDVAKKLVGRPPHNQHQLLFCLKRRVFRQRPRSPSLRSVWQHTRRRGCDTAGFFWFARDCVCFCVLRVSKMWSSHPCRWTFLSNSLASSKMGSRTHHTGESSRGGVGTEAFPPEGNRATQEVPGVVDIGQPPAPKTQKNGTLWREDLATAGSASRCWTTASFHLLRAPEIPEGNGPRCARQKDPAHGSGRLRGAGSFHLGTWTALIRVARGGQGGQQFKITPRMEPEPTKSRLVRAARVRWKLSYHFVRDLAVLAFVAVCCEFLVSCWCVVVWLFLWFPSVAAFSEFSSWEGQGVRSLGTRSHVEHETGIVHSGVLCDMRAFEHGSASDRSLSRLRRLEPFLSHFSVLASALLGASCGSSLFF